MNFISKMEGPDFGLQNTTIICDEYLSILTTLAQNSYIVNKMRSGNT